MIRTMYFISHIAISTTFSISKVRCRSLIFSSYLILCPTKLNFFQVSCSNSITIISLIEYNLDKRPKTWNKLIKVEENSVQCPDWPDHVRSNSSQNILISNAALIWDLNEKQKEWNVFYFCTFEVLICTHWMWCKPCQRVQISSKGRTDGWLVRFNETVNFSKFQLQILNSLNMSI